MRTGTCAWFIFPYNQPVIGEDAKITTAIAIAKKKIAARRYRKIIKIRLNTIDQNTMLLGATSWNPSLDNVIQSSIIESPTINQQNIWASVDI
jgi:hypothetical protein